VNLVALHCGLSWCAGHEMSISCSRIGCVVLPVVTGQ